MDPRPGTENGSDPPGDGRIDESSNNDTSISQLVSGLRDSFLMTDFDRVEETLVAREARLKQEIEKSKREIGSLQEKIEVERLRRVRAEIEIEKKRARELCDEVSVKEEKCMLDDDDSVGVGAENKNSRLVEEKRAAELSAECWKRKFYELNQQLLAHNSGNNDEKKITGVDVASAPLKRNEDIRLSTLKSASIPSKDGSGASGGRLGIGMAFDIGDKDKEACKTMDKKETTSGSGNKAYNGYPSSIAVQHKNLPTRLAEPVGILKRKIPLHKFGRNINFNLLDQLDGIDSDTSSSSSDSSGSLDMDSFTLSSLARNKKMRTEADSSLRLNSTSRARWLVHWKPPSSSSWNSFCSCCTRIACTHRIVKEMTAWR